MIGRATIALFMVALAGGAKAQDCRAVPDDKARLACYDAASQPKTPEQLTPSAPTARAEYANRVRRAFLANGVSMDVFWPEKPDPKNSIVPPRPKDFPQLVFFGFINQAFVYQMITKVDVLKGARDVGFKSVLFQSKGAESWSFDLSGPNLPSCDISKRFCI